VPPPAGALLPKRAPLDLDDAEFCVAAAIAKAHGGNRTDCASVQMSTATPT